MKNAAKNEQRNRSRIPCSSGPPVAHFAMGDLPALSFEGRPCGPFPIGEVFRSEIQPPDIDSIRKTSRENLISKPQFLIDSPKIKNRRNQNKTKASVYF